MWPFVRVYIAETRGCTVQLQGRLQLTDFFSVKACVSVDQYYYYNQITSLPKILSNLQKNHDPLLIWTKKICQLIPPGGLNLFLIQYWLVPDQHFFKQCFPNRFRSNHFSKKCPKSKLDTTFTLKTFKIMKLSCLVKKYFSLKKNRTLVFVIFYICNHNPKNVQVLLWLQIWKKDRYSNTSQTRGSKLAKFSNSRFLLLFFTSKLALPFISTQIHDSCFF